MPVNVCVLWGNSLRAETPWVNVDIIEWPDRSILGARAGGLVVTYRGRERAEVVMKERQSVHAELLAKRDVEPVLDLSAHAFVFFVVTSISYVHYHSHRYGAMHINCYSTFRT